LILDCHRVCDGAGGFEPVKVTCNHETKIEEKLKGKDLAIFGREDG
jgi:hypothetical protein